MKENIKKISLKNKNPLINNFVAPKSISLKFRKELTGSDLAKKSEQKPNFVDNYILSIIKE